MSISLPKTIRIGDVAVVDDKVVVANARNRRYERKRGVSKQATIKNKRVEAQVSSIEELAAKDS